MVFIPVFSQNNQVEGQIYMVVEKMPLYDGATTDEESNKKLQQFITKRAKEFNVESKGLVFISFTINPEGNVINAKVLRGVSEKTDESALAIINDLKPWTAGIQRGRNVLVEYTVKVEFK